MSASAVNPVPPPAPGSSGQPNAAGVGAGGHAKGPPTGFEALLALFDAPAGEADTANAATAGAAAGTGAAAGAGANGSLPAKLAKAAAGVAGDGQGGGKDDGKGKVAGEAKDAAGATGNAAATAAGAIPDAMFALLIPAPSAATVVAATPKGTATTTTTTTATAGPTSGKAADAALAKLLGATAPGEAADSPGKAQATAAGAVAVDAAAAAKTAATAALKAGAPLAATPAAPGAAAASPPAAELPAPPPPTGAAATPVATTPPPVLAANLDAKPQPQPQGITPTPSAPAKGRATKGATRVEGARVDAAPNVDTSQTLAAKAANALQPLADSGAKGAADEQHDPAALAPEAKPDPGGPSAPAGRLDTAATTTPATLMQAAAVAVRGAPQTVANLAAQIAKKLDGRSTRFDVQLEPAGLGKVDVRVEIGAGGKMSAAMAFDNPQAAADLRSRSGELQRALEQAGFDLSGGLSFDVAADSGQGGRTPGQDSSANSGAAFRGQAFQAALDATADPQPASQLMFRRASASGVDIRI